MLLSQCDNTSKERILLLLWRAWYLRDDIVHHKGTASIAESVVFLSNYWYCLNGDIRFAHDLKGKSPVAATPRAKYELSAHAFNWTRAPVGVMKVNSDASFIATSSLAAAGVIARNSDGEVLFSAGWTLPKCSDDEEAEGQAMLLGMQTLEKIYDVV